MRLWLLALMLAAILSFWPLVRPGITSLVAKGPKLALRTQVPNESVSPSFSTVVASALSNTKSLMTDNVAVNGNPMSILSQAGPADASTLTTATSALPKLSANDFRVYNRLAVMMDAYHNHFRQTWNMWYSSCTNNERPKGMSIRVFINTGLQLCHHLTIHHTIEEQHIFPGLAERMPGFKDDEILLNQHASIHEGLEKTEEYLEQCRRGERELRTGELKAILDSYGTVLWTHLDEEVRMLGAENMRKYWSKEEILGMNW